MVRRTYPPRQSRHPTSFAFISHSQSSAPTPSHHQPHKSRQCPLPPPLRLLSSFPKLTHLPSELQTIILSYATALEIRLHSHRHSLSFIFRNVSFTPNLFSFVLHSRRFDPFRIRHSLLNTSRFAGSVALKTYLKDVKDVRDLVSKGRVVRMDMRLRRGMERRE